MGRPIEAQKEVMKGCLSFVVLLIVSCAVAAMAKIIAWTIIIIIGVICLLVIIGLVKLVIKVLF